MKKKLFDLAVAVVLLAGCIVYGTNMVNAMMDNIITLQAITGQSSSTQINEKWRVRGDGANGGVIVWSVVAKSATDEGLVDSTAMNSTLNALLKENGYALYSVATAYASATTVTGDSDLFFYDEQSTDILGGAGTNMMDDNTYKYFRPVLKQTSVGSTSQTSFYAPIVTGDISYSVSNNDATNATMGFEAVFIQRGR